MDSIPKYSSPNTLPSIQSFNLSHILSHDLENESNQLAQSLKQVSTNYRKDLKNEIRLKLSIQQKLQNKNIEISKFIKTLNKKTNKELVKISEYDLKALDEELDEILIMTDDMSRDFKRVAKNLAKINELVGNDNPVPESLTNYLNPRVERNGTKDNRGIKLNDPVPSDPVANDPVANDPVANDPGANDPGASVTVSTTVTSELTGNIQPPKQDFEEMTSKDFEKFMATTLNTYRSIQNQKYKTLDIFTDTHNISSNESQPSAKSTTMLNLETNLDQLYNQPHFDNSLSSSFHTSQNPIDLLTTSFKAPPIVTQSLTTSHFKKLRISSPSATTKNPPLPDNYTESGNEITSTVINTSATSSPAISTETDSGISDDILTTSDSDSDSDGNGGNTIVDEYYKNLHKNLMKRRRRIKYKYPSPTPKFEPNHHSIKPKASILKNVHKPLNGDHGLNNTHTKRVNHTHEDQEYSRMVDTKEYYDEQMKNLHQSTSDRINSASSSSDDDNHDISESVSTLIGTKSDHLYNGMLHDDNEYNEETSN